MLGWMRGYYAIVDVAPPALEDLPALEARAARLLQARPACLQLRAKGAPGASLRAGPRACALCVQGRESRSV
jgi:hypothetical protein